MAGSDQKGSKTHTAICNNGLTKAEMCLVTNGIIFKAMRLICRIALVIFITEGRTEGVRNYGNDI